MKAPWLKPIVTLTDLRKDNTEGQESEGGRWMLICERHIELCQFETKRIALEFKAHSYEWCEQCMDEYYPERQA